MAPGTEIPIPDDIVVLDQPGEFIYPFPEWARWAIVTVRGADGGNGAHSPGEPGQSKTVKHRITERTAHVVLGRAGRDWDGERRNQNAYVLLELFG